jgi:hypothetical protein
MANRFALLLLLLASCKSHQEQLVEDCQYWGGAPNIRHSFECEKPGRRTQLRQQTERF